MNEHISKRSFLEVYSSEEEEIADVNRLQEEFAESTDNESVDFNNNVAFELEIGDTFEDWSLAEKQIERYATETGFEVVKRRVGKNKHGEIISRTFECKNSRD